MCFIPVIVDFAVDDSAEVDCYIVVVAVLLILMVKSNTIVVRVQTHHDGRHAYLTTRIESAKIKWWCPGLTVPAIDWCASSDIPTVDCCMVMFVSRYVSQILRFQQLFVVCCRRFRRLIITLLFIPVWPFKRLIGVRRPTFLWLIVAWCCCFTMRKPEITNPAVVYCVLSPSMIPMVDCCVLVIVAYSFSYDAVIQ